VHGVGQLSADGGIPSVYRTGLFGQVGQDDRAESGVSAGVVSGCSGDAGTQDPGELGGGVRAAHPRFAQAPFEPVEQVRVAVAAEFDFDLAPRGALGGRAHGLRGDVVVDDLDEITTVLVGQAPLPTNCGELSDGLERDVAGERAGQCDQLGRGLRVAAAGLASGEAHAYLIAAVHGDRQLEVPAAVGAAAASPQRHTRRGQPQIRGVEVHGFEQLLLGTDDVHDSGQSRPPREPGVLVEVVLAFGSRTVTVTCPGYLTPRYIRQVDSG
jgi:hypothetical protein